jgi:hypothetical protein
MEKQNLRTDRLRGIRESDQNSGSNRKLRKSMFNVALAIVKAFFPDPANARVGAYGGLRSGLTLIEMIDPMIGSEKIDGRTTVLRVWGHPAIAFGQGKIIPSRGMLALKEARNFAEEMESGSLRCMLEELAVFRGQEKANELASKLGIRR